MAKRKHGDSKAVENRNDGIPNGLSGRANQKRKKKKKATKRNQKRLMQKMQRANGLNPREMAEENSTEEKKNVSVEMSKSDISNNLGSKSHDAEDRLDLGNTSVRPKSKLQQAFLSRLAGSRFRELNEDLYTTNSSSAYERFQKNPELFDQYHEGFRTQVKSWPKNPVDVVHKWIISVHKKRAREEKKCKLRIADFGCGDAKLAEKLLQIREEKMISKSAKRRKKNNEVSGDASKSVTCPFKVHSFDLVANGNPNIQPCDMANVPIPDSSVDIGVFVLALMGTNIADFIREAHRVLTPDGKLKIAEVRSRFESGVIGEEESNGKSKGGKGEFTYSKKKSDDSLLNHFLDVMNQLGFNSTKMDKSNKMFLLMEFEKIGKKPDKDATFTAKPCIYKRR
uniref:Ribosomal RNA-processing protein 8 n=1 Tax=Chaetoceros debilis TaxID=122233 RepID=A0A6S8UDW5_9STRA|mmetsp:Transcript_7231/g.10309  ORF Transcript_7231/g.10309 Transcript_7231/m.10309 type:complete len:396 (+) Transcript_7231:99-1286(+)